MNANKFKRYLNGKNLFINFNLIIQTGTARLLDYPERKKKSLSNDWAEENGQEYDLSKNQNLKIKEVTLSCAMMAPDDGDFWFYYQAFFSGDRKENRIAATFIYMIFPNVQGIL